MKLSGDRNQCQGCKEHFNSTTAFDKHRRGDFGNEENPRRCLTPMQMTSQGMAKNADGFWITKPRIFDDHGHTINRVPRDAA